MRLRYKLSHNPILSRSLTGFFLIRNRLRPVCREWATGTDEEARNITGVYMDRFLLCENPMRDNSETVYVLHTGRPNALFKIKLLSNDKPVESQLSKGVNASIICEYQSSEGVERWEVTVKRNYDNALERELMDGLADRAWRWFEAYLKWEDGNIDTERQAIYN